MISMVATATEYVGPYMWEHMCAYTYAVAAATMLIKNRAKIS